MLTFEIDALRIRIFGIVRAPEHLLGSPHNGVYWGWFEVWSQWRFGIRRRHKCQQISIPEPPRLATSTAQP
jgi:hypothetical protein